MNEDLLRRTISAMEEDPEHWDQHYWVETPYERSEEVPICKTTTLCFAGFVLLVDMGAEDFYARALQRDHSGRWDTKDAFTNTIPERATDALGLDPDAADVLYTTFTDDLEEFKEAVTELTGVAFDR